jgi:hypothetical protein
MAVRASSNQNEFGFANLDKLEIFGWSPFGDTKPVADRGPGIGVCLPGTYPCAVKDSLQRAGDSTDPNRKATDAVDVGDWWNAAKRRVLREIEGTQKIDEAVKKRAATAAAGPAPLGTEKLLMFLLILGGGFIAYKKLA